MVSTQRKRSGILLTLGMWLLGCIVQVVRLDDAFVFW